MKLFFSEQLLHRFHLYFCTDAFAAGEHEYVALNKQIEAEIAAKCNAHPLLKALGNDSESRLRLAYSCFRVSVASSVFVTKQVILNCT